MERFGMQGVQFALTLVLARLLSPKEYGLIGMLMVFCALGQVFTDSGLSTALVQRPTNSADDEATVFYLNIGAGSVLSLFLCAVSPLVAAFYEQPILKPMLCVMSLEVFQSSFGIVQFALMSREMNFRSQAIISTLSVILSGCVGIAMALTGYGVWSLVGQFVAAGLFRTLLVWIMGDWRMTGRFRRASLQSVWPFSSSMLASQLLNTVFDSLYSIVIGRVYRPADLGLFTRAQGFANFPTGFVTSIFVRTTLPAFAQLQTDPQLFKSSVRKVFRILAAVHFPAMAGIAVAAAPLVRFLLSEKWVPCVPYLQILAFSGMLYPLHALHVNALLARGRSDLLLRLEIIKKVLIALALVSTFRFGVSAMVWGMLAFSVVCLAINGYYTRKLLGYGWLEQVLDLGPVLGATSVMAAAMLIVAYPQWMGFAGRWSWSFDSNNGLTLLLVQAAVGLIIYGLITGFSRIRAYVELRSQVFSSLGWSTNAG
jgi:O-antigen/teichoic acid export membrane protein